MYQYQTHQTLYFVDGNVALCARRSPGHYLVFRVHQSMLSKVSPVFEHMFTLPTGDAEEKEKFEGVPLVHMPECADELESLLKVLYHESVLPYKRLDPRTPHSVKQILSLASKYDMVHFRHRIIDHIELDWPQSLWKWDLIERETDSLQKIWHKREPEPGCPRPYIDDCLPEPASAIRLARECDIPSILPAAFYHLSRLSIYDDWSDARQCLEIQSSRYEGLDIGRRTAEWSMLAAGDFVCLLKGQARLRVAAAEMLHFGLDGYDLDHSSDDCSSLRRSKMLQEIQEACRYSRDILHTTHAYMERKDFGDSICHGCCSRIKDDLSTFRRHLWIKLSDLFSLQ